MKKTWTDTIEDVMALGSTQEPLTEAAMKSVTPGMIQEICRCAKAFLKGDVSLTKARYVESSKKDLQTWPPGKGADEEIKFSSRKSQGPASTRRKTKKKGVFRGADFTSRAEPFAPKRTPPGIGSAGFLFEGPYTSLLRSLSGRNK